MLTEMRVETKPVIARKNDDVQLLTFKLDDQEYALNIAHVVQVIRMVAVTRAPKAPDYVEGMFNLRGKVVPVVDIRKRCGLPPKPCGLNTQLVVARANGRTLALTVDAVSEVLTMPAANIETPDDIGPEMQHLRAVGKLGDRLVLILDPDTLLTEAEMRLATTAQRMPE